MDKDEYTPPRITRREAVGKFGAAGAGATGAGAIMGSPMGGGGLGTGSGSGSDSGSGDDSSLDSGSDSSSGDDDTHSMSRWSRSTGSSGPENRESFERRE